MKARKSGPKGTDRDQSFDDYVEETVQEFDAILHDEFQLPASYEFFPAVPATLLADLVACQAEALHAKVPRVSDAFLEWCYTGISARHQVALRRVKTLAAAVSTAMTPTPVRTPSRHPSPISDPTDCTAIARDVADPHAAQTLRDWCYTGINPAALEPLTPFRSLEYQDTWQGSPTTISPKSEPAGPSQVREMVLRSEPKFYTPHITLPRKLPLSTKYLRPVIPKSIYLYSHYDAIEDIIKSLLEDKKSRQYPSTRLCNYLIRVLPRSILIAPKRGRQEIIVIDPVGRDFQEERWTFLKEYQNLFTPDYPEILRQFILDTGGKGKDIQDYRVLAIPSHAHPDHYMGLRQLIGTVPNVDVLMHRQTFQDIRELSWPSRELAGLTTTLSPHFFEEMCRLFTLFYGNGKLIQDMLRRDNHIQIGLLEEQGSSIGGGSLLAHEYQSGDLFYQLDDSRFRWAFPKNIHGTTSLVFTYQATRIQKIMFLGDLFPPAAALGSSTLPADSFQKLMQFYESFDRGQETHLLTSHYFYAGERYNASIEANPISPDLFSSKFLFSPPLNTLRTFQKSVRIFCEEVENVYGGYPFEKILLDVGNKERKTNTYIQDLLGIFLGLEMEKVDHLYSDRFAAILLKNAERVSGVLPDFIKSGLSGSPFQIFQETDPPFQAMALDPSQYVTTLNDKVISLTELRQIVKFITFLWNLMNGCQQRGS